MENIVSIRESDGNIVKMEVHNALINSAELAREYAEKGYPDRYAVFSSRKLKPKGTEKSESEIESDYGVFLSIILRPSLFPSQASLLGAMSATSLTLALEEHTKKRIGIGWLSEIYCEGVRIGSTSVEGKLDSFGSYEYIIVSFSAVLSKRNFPPRLTDMIRKVFESENISISMIVARTVLTKFFSFYTKIKNSSKFMNVYAQKFILRGVRVKYEHEQKKRICKVLGVDKKTGTLILTDRRGNVIEVFSHKSVIIPKKIKLKSIKE